MAVPLAIVVALAVAEPPVNVPLAPLPGAVKVTVTPLNVFPPESLTVATSGLAKAALIATLCGVPLVGVTLDGVPAWFVRLKTAAVATPGVLADTE